MISFIDDNRILLRAVIDRDYNSLSSYLRSDELQRSYDYVDDDGSLIAYKVFENKPLTKLYDFPVYVVRFYFADIEVLHCDSMEERLCSLMESLKQKTVSQPGYYNFRIPSHVVDLIKAFNRMFPQHIFCGGTVEEYINGKDVMVPEKTGLTFGRVDDETMKNIADSLVEIAEESFTSYQGQYHISEVTAPKAGQIYMNWIRNGLWDNPRDVMVAWYNGVPCGFGLTAFDAECRVSDLLLTAVSKEYRGQGIYKALISKLINEANDMNYAFVSSTQFDNFGSQHTWGSLGMGPFYSIYNIHLDRR